MPTIAKTPGQAIGESLQALRVERGLRQDEVAAEARALGLSWTRATIAAIETGRRELSVGELWLLPWLYHVEVPDLVKAPVVQVTPDVTMPGHLARASASGRALRTPYTTWASEPDANSKDMSDRLMTRVGRSRQVRRSWPDATDSDIRAAAADAGGEVEVRAAHRLGIDSMGLALAARRR